jgi:DNA-binding transcriptional ArsR family regulator
MGMDIYSAIAEPTRRQILEMLAKEGELPASEIYHKFTVSHPAISQHLKVLREANLVTIEKRKQQRIYQLNPTPMLELEEWIKRMTKFWNERFDALDKLLIEEKKRLEKNTKKSSNDTERR